MQRWNVRVPGPLAVRAGDTLPFAVSLALALAIAYYLARLVWWLVPGPARSEWSPPALIAAPTTNAVTGDAAAYAAIVNAHLFGLPSAQPDVSKMNAEDAPQTQLALQLRGVVAAADDRFAHAIVADNSGVEKVYFLKDTLPGGGVVERIQPDRIILSRGGVLEALVLPRVTPGGAAGPTPRSNPSIGRRLPTPSPSMQEAVAGNANSITEIIRPQPYMPNGEMRGYRVYPGRNREQFVALGLQPGDLITEINGVTLNNPGQAMELFRSLAETNQMTVAVERNGQVQTLTLDTQQVASAGGAAK